MQSDSGYDEVRSTVWISGMCCCGERGWSRPSVSRQVSSSCCLRAAQPVALRPSLPWQVGNPILWPLASSCHRRAACGGWEQPPGGKLGTPGLPPSSHIPCVWGGSLGWSTCRKREVRPAGMSKEPLLSSRHRYTWFLVALSIVKDIWSYLLGSWSSEPHWFWQDTIWLGKGRLVERSRRRRWIGKK